MEKLRPLIEFGGKVTSVVDPTLPYLFGTLLIVGLLWFKYYVLTAMVIPALRGKKDALGNVLVDPYLSKKRLYDWRNE